MLPRSSTVRSYLVTACLPPWRRRSSPSPHSCRRMGRGELWLRTMLAQPRACPPPGTQPQVIDSAQPCRQQQPSNGRAIDRKSAQSRSSTRTRIGDSAMETRRQLHVADRQARLAREPPRGACDIGRRKLPPARLAQPKLAQHASDPLPPGFRASLEPAPGLQHRRIAAGIARGPVRKSRPDGQDLLPAPLRHGQSARSPRDRRRWCAIAPRR